MTTPDGTVEEVEEEVVEEIELGDNPNDLFAKATDIEELVFVFNNKKWIVKYRNLAWQEKNECVEEAQIYDVDEKGNTSFKFSLSKYYTASLIKMIVEAPFSPVTETILSKLDAKVGGILQTIVPNPADPDLASAIKKE